ncbi:hypothetical protein SPWS13_2846 [Shewanella putrefaciens]|nr:hypothetical protein SPWS13_2846 [Shewanella putrefaciens]
MFCILLLSQEGLEFDDIADNRDSVFTFSYPIANLVSA